MALHRHGLDGSAVPHIGTAIERRIGVEQLLPSAWPWHADAVAGAWHRRHVARNKNWVRLIIAKAKKGEQRVLPIIAHHPTKAGIDTWPRMQCGFKGIDAVQFAPEPLNTSTQWVFTSAPIEFAVVV